MTGATSFVTSLATAGFILALFTFILTLFTHAENVASPDLKLRITRWVKNVEPRRASNWPSTFAQMFDHVFGSRHLTWRCFWRSCLASLAAVAILLLLWWALYPKDVYAFLAGKTPISDMLISPIVPTIPFFIMILVANF